MTDNRGETCGDTEQQGKVSFSSKVLFLVFSYFF